MTEFQFTPISDDGFSAEATFEAGQLTVKFSGTAELRAQQHLVEILARLHTDARRLEVKMVAVDLRALDFMNSSCFKSFVTWLSDVQELPPAQQYRINFLSNPKIRWQRASLHALSCFAVDLVQIENG